MDLKHAKKISRALADDTRLQILQQIKNKTNCLQCEDIFEVISLSQPSISHHVKQLIDVDLVSQEKEGRRVKYRLNQKVLDEYIAFLGRLRTV